MVHYLPVEEHHSSPELGEYQSFGLRVVESAQQQDDRDVMYLADISTDFLFVLHLAQLLTQHQLRPIHLLDVIEDLL